MTSRIWIALAGVALVVAGMAWLSKLAVIVATDGRVAYTGAAGAFFAIGLYLLLIGSTRVGLRLTADKDTGSRIAGVVLSPVVFVVSFMVLQGVVVGLWDITQAFAGLGPDYFREEATILLTAVASLMIGVTLLLGSIRRSRSVPAA